jgi:hypothetical protein
MTSPPITTAAASGYRGTGWTIGGRRRGCVEGGLAACCLLRREGVAFARPMRYLGELWREMLSWVHEHGGI